MRASQHQAMLLGAAMFVLLNTAFVCLQLSDAFSRSVPSVHDSKNIRFEIRSDDLTPAETSPKMDDLLSKQIPDDKPDHIENIPDM